ncbi:MAG: type I restriction-modification enzyme R subunit C-terminal domain-containing protein [Actinomadura sp.]
MDQFRRKNADPHIAVSVDMLDTGIDIPEVVNLVFAKLVRSKTKFWQMIGRGTRLCRDLFGPGQDKKQFLVFDLGRNVEFFNSDIPEADARVQPSLGERLFAQRTELLYTLDHLYPDLSVAPEAAEGGEAVVRKDVAIRLQLGLLVGDPGYDALRQQVQRIAEDLLDPTTLNNPVVDRHADFITEVAGDAWWEDVTLPMLEHMRRVLRGLVRLIPAKRRGVVYTDFEDELGELTPAELKGIDVGTNRSRFERKVKYYLRSHENDLVVQKLLRGRQITTSDLEELKHIFLDLGFGTEADIELVTEEHQGFGLFLRSITGLQREAAVAAFDDFQAGKTLSPAEHDFLDLIIDSLAKNGIVEVGHLYEQPFTSRAPHGPDSVFSDTDVDGIAHVLTVVKNTAIPTDAKAG